MMIVATAQSRHRRRREAGALKIYVDTLFLLNFIVNYLLLLVAARVAGYPFKRWRIALAAAFGGAYAVAVFLPGAGFLSSLPAKLVSGVLLAFVAYGFFGPRVFLKRTTLFFAASFLLGGAVYAVGLFAAESPVGLRNGVLYTGAELKVVLLAAAALYLLLSLLFHGAARGARRTVSAVRVALDGREVSFPALVDTGNTLSDPLTNAPVLVVERAAVLPVLPRAVRSLIDDEALRDATGTLEALALLGEGRRFRLIPYRVVGNERGMLVAFRPDSVTIDGKRADSMLVALSPTALSDGAAYSALVGV